MKKDSLFKNLLKGVKNKLLGTSVNPYKEINLSWLKIKYYKHLPPGKIKTHTLFNRSLYFYDSVQLVFGLKEVFIEASYRQKFRDNPYIIDCGANIGLSIIYYKRISPSAEILAFEPDESNYSLLEKNMHSFAYPDVTIRKEAVWTQNTTLQFLNEGSMSSKINNNIDNKNTVAVKAVRLKDFLTRKVDFLKIDIEGAEYEVLKDISDKLYLVENMFIEYHGTFDQNKELTELIQTISEHGFNYYIKEAASLFDFPFERFNKSASNYDIQLNLFCFRTQDRS